MSAYLLPLAAREPLEWVLREQRTALPRHRAGEAKKLNQGDRVFLYATRGCFGNPTRDRGRIIGLATVTNTASELDDPMRFAGREFPVGVGLRIERLARRREGVELAPLVKRLRTFPDPNSWSARMRRALVPLDDRDVALLEREVSKVTAPYPRAVESYAA